MKKTERCWELALACLHAGVLLIDDVNTALAADNAVVAVTALERFERVYDFHIYTLIMGTFVRRGGTLTAEPLFCQLYLFSYQGPSAI
jgi:hypothetical protein